MVYETTGTSTIFINSETRDIGVKNNFTKVVPTAVLDNKVHTCDRIKVKLVDFITTNNVNNITQYNNKFVVSYRHIDKTTGTLSGWNDEEFTIPPGFYDSDKLLETLNSLTGACGSDGDADIEWSYNPDKPNVLGVKMNQATGPIDDPDWRIHFENNYSAKNVLGSHFGEDILFEQLAPYEYFKYPINLRYTKSIFIEMSLCDKNVICVNRRTANGTLEQGSVAHNTSIIARIPFGDVAPGEPIIYSGGGDGSAFYTYINEWQPDLNIALYDENLSPLQLTDDFTMSIKADFQKYVPDKINLYKQ